MMVFSGDIGQEKNIILARPTHITNANYVIMESTYGGRDHKDLESKREQLRDVINATIAKKGKVIIPSFSLERTQELLYYLKQLEEDGEIPPTPVYLDSPLAAKITKLYNRHDECFNKEIVEEMKSNDHVFFFKDLTITSDHKSSIKLNNLHGSAIIIAGSGMCTGGRILHHLKHNIWDAKNTILFIGYQGVGTLGRQLVEGKTRIQMMNQYFSVRANIESIHGFSGHAGQKELIKWSKDIDCSNKRSLNSTIFVCHGDEDQAQIFAEKIARQNRKTIVPSMVESYELEIII